MKENIEIYLLEQIDKNNEMAEELAKSIFIQLNELMSCLYTTKKLKHYKNIIELKSSSK